MNPAARVFVLLALASLSAPRPASARGFEHPSFASNQRRPARVMVLAPQSSIARARLTHATGLIKESAALERSCAEAIAKSLDSLGYSGDATSLDPTRLGEDRELFSLVTAFQDRVDDLLGLALDRPRDVAEGRFTLGEDVLPLAARTKAEGFIVVHARAIVPSRGTRTMSAIFSVLGGMPPVPPTNSTRGIIVMVDGRTGDLAWLDAAEVSGAVAKEPGVVGAKLGSALMRSYPRAGQVLEPRKKRKKGEASEAPPSVPQGDDDGQSTEQVLAAFETAAREEEASAAEAAAPAAPAAPVIEDVQPRDEFQAEDGSALRAAAAPAMEAGDAPASPAGAAGGTPAPPSEQAAPAPTAEELASVRTAWNVAESERPAPTRQVVIQMMDGAPGLVVRNMSEPAVRVSIDLGGWTPLEPGERVRQDAPAGMHRVLVVDAEGREVARGSVLVGPSTTASVEIWPRG